MPQAVGSISTVTPELPPESIVNLTLDPVGRAVNSFLGKIYSTDQMAHFATVFTVRHMIADEIERLMALLDELSGDEHLELNAGGDAWGNPRLDDAEGDTADSEPSLGSNSGIHQGYWGVDDRSLFTLDLELDTSDDEPSLCGVTVERGDDRDIEDNLGSFDRMVDQTRSLRVRSGVGWPVHDGESDSRPAS